MMRRLFTPLLGCSVLSVCSLADTIHLTDGKTIANVQVVDEGLVEVSYKEGRVDKDVPAEAVLSIDYEKKPAPMVEAEELVLAEDYLGAAEVLEAYVEAMSAKPAPGTPKGAPAAAAWRAVEMRLSLIDLEGTRLAAGRLLQAFPDSRFVPQAYLAKAEAEQQMGRAAEAKETLTAMAGLVAAKSLPQRWQLECRLGQAVADDKIKPDSRRNEIERVLSEAASLPSVSSRAQMLLGESYMAEATVDRARAKDLRSKARGAFEKVLAHEAASREALAAAHAGMGETLFLQGADSEDKAALQESVLHFLRVATLYRDQGRSMAKSLFFAMRCFDLLPDPRRKAEMKRELLALYPQSTWAVEAKKY